MNKNRISKMTDREIVTAKRLPRTGFASARAMREEYKNTATKSEKACEDMADVCELAHKRTVRECKKNHIQVDCTSSMLCGDNSQHVTDEDGTHYTTAAQDIFNRHYDYITNITGI